MTFDPAIAIYGAVACLIWFGYAMIRRRNETRDKAIQQEAVEAGLTEPASLHPDFDPAFCVGCGACVRVCPEGNVIGLINGKAELINPAECIGHGACAQSCPTHAIELVFGTATRGVDIPHVAPDFETNVPGIFIAGELGGMGLVRNAIEQGRQAMASIAKRPRATTEATWDVIIVGSGPAGISAALAAKQAGLRYLVIEQDDLGGTVFKYPRNKLIMTSPATLPIGGKVKFTEVRKEKWMEFWRSIEKEQKININYREKVDAVSTAPDGSFEVTTSLGSHRASSILLSIGRRGTPRTLGVPGEQMPKVVYSLIDPEQYRDQRVVIVGGGDSALEAAASIAEEPGSTVTLSYRSEAFSRAKTKNRDRVAKLQAEHRLEILYSTNIREITADGILIDASGQPIRRPNDAVIVSAGGILPTKFLQSIGVTMETKYGTA